MIKIEITGIHDLVHFVRIIRNQEITDEQIEKLVTQLNQGANKLEEAVEDNKP
jgi:hypothetical protein